MTRALLALALLAPAAVGAQPIRMDGEFEDWRDVVAVAIGEGRIRSLAVTADRERVYFQIVLRDSLNLQGARLPIGLTIEGPGPVLGEPGDDFAGGDLVLAFSPAPAHAGSAVRLPGDTVYRGPDALDLRYAPAYASDRFEVAVSRTAAGAAPLAGDTIRGWIAAGSDTVPFLARVPRDPWVPPTPMGMPTGELIVLNWNMGDDTPLRSPDPYRRVLAASGARVILMDELSPSIDEAAIRGLLPPGDWTIVLGRGGGRQRTAVATTLPAEPSPALARVAWPDSVEALPVPEMRRQLRGDIAAVAEGVPSTGAIVTWEDRRILFVPVDLPCCGFAGNVDDRARVMAATAVAAAIRTSLRTEGVEAVVIAGDLNLVGSHRPLDRLTRGLAPGGGDLVTADLRNPGDGSNATWRAPGPFAPGRLDWVVYSDGPLEHTGGLVLDTESLTGATLLRHGLQRTDTRVTDHLPLVARFRVR